MRYGLPHYTDSGHFLCFRQTVSGIRCPYIFYLHECHHLFLSLTVGIPFVKILCLSTYIIAYGTRITTETICHLSVSYVLIVCYL